MDAVMGFIWKAVMFIAMLSIIIFVLTNPQMIVGLFSMLVNGVSTIVQGIANAVSSIV